MTDSRPSRLATLGRIYRQDGRWLGLATGLSIFLVSLYYVTHPYPAYGGGLYLAIVEEILAHGYQPPRTIPHYTAGGVPFAYPPLLFYIYAVLVDIGIDPIAFMRILPGLFTVAYLIPYYYLSRELLNTPRQAGIATAAFATIPVASQWHLTAGGLVRAPALLFTLSGLYGSVKLFAAGRRSWLLPTTAFFGVTVLTHPQYATFFGVGTLLMYLFFDRSVRGVVYGLLIAGGGLALATPWWSRVLLMYGIDPLTSAAGTHGGLLNGPATLIRYLIVPIGSGMAVVYIGLLVGGIILLTQRRYFLPVWVLIVTQYTAAPRYLFVPGAMLFAVGAINVGSPWLNRLSDHFPTRSKMTAVLLAIGVLMTAMGGVAVWGAVVSPASYVSYLSEEDVEAMQWARAETPADAEFVVVGDVADWFPYVAERTSLVNPWGVEWVSSAQYRYHIEMTRQFVECRTAGCLTEGLNRHELSPEYLYIPNGRITARGIDRVQPARMRQSLIDSDRYRVVYENNDVIIVSLTSSSA